MFPTAAGAATSKSRTYDVFINHRGPDVKKTFVAHLYAALSSRGFRPFLDAEDIAYTLPVFEKIDKALKDACVHVAIFSKGYADSIYCLDELCDMLKSKERIIPVFFDVEAGDLRRIEDGLYNKAFINHEERGRTQKIPIWKAALRKVADYRAFRMDEVNGNEHQLIRRILVEVRNALRPDLLSRKRFGMKKSMKDVVKTLESVSVIGLVGMGGIGKTTLAMEIYNHFLSHQHFENYCFLRDVQSSQTSMLREKVLHDLRLGTESCCNDQEYRRILNGALKDRRMLVIVDDISDANQFEAVIPEILIICGLDSRIVITSRRHDVLNNVMKALPAPSKFVYEVQMLDKFDSRRLFNIHAFMSDTPREEFVELAETIADACGGLPLALEVMGNYLFDKEKPEDKEIWSEAVKVLQENAEIMDKLRVSYDGLPTDGDREMFQDIACMLIGVKQEVAMTIWKSCKNCRCSSSKTPASSLRNLVDRSLVKLDEHERLCMHDVLRDMGREIVKTDGLKGQGQPPKKWRHLWDRTIAEKELSRGKVNTRVRGICLTVREPDDQNYLHSRNAMSCEATNLGSMKELHLLNLDGCNVVHANFSSWSQQLRWLQWRFYSFRSFPSQLQLPHLVVLDLSCSRELTCLWEQNVHMRVNLSQLVVLDLTNCIKLTCLWKNDAHIQLPQLQVLRLLHCISLVALPNNLGRRIPRLKRLEMTGCKSLRMLPNSIGLFTKLEHLDLQYCSNLITLTNHSIAELVNLAQLVVLDLTSCRKLTCLWEDDASVQLPRLEVLTMDDCIALVGLPNNLGSSVPQLKRLKMTGCRSLRTLPKSIALLAELEHLDLHNCSNLITLTYEIMELVNLAQLVGLDLTNCRILTCLWGNDVYIQLPQLQVLTVDDCISLIGLPNNFGRSVPQLKRLEMRGCWSLQMLPNSIALLTKLEQLDLQYCSNLITLANVIVESVNLAQLVVLDLTSCIKLTSLWDNDALIQLPLLKELILVNCIALIGLPNNLGRSIPQLKRLKMRGCWNLQTLPNSLGVLTELEYLDLRDCSNLITFTNTIVELVSPKTFMDHLPMDFRLLTSLRSLSIDILDSVHVHFNGLKAHLFVDGRVDDVDMHSLGALTTLQSLHLTRFTNDISQILESLGKLKYLVKVRILQWEELWVIEELPECLEHLSLEGCRNLIEIPSLMPMKSLVHLNLMNCQSLRHIHGLECVTTLECINLINCALIENNEVNINKDNKALRKCYLMGSKVGVGYNNKWLEDEPCQQFISCRGDRIPSCLPNGRMAHPGSWPPTISSPALLAEATISRKAECIVITWCTIFHLGDECYVTPHTLRFEILRGRCQLAIKSDISLPSMKSDRLGDRQVHVLTLRRKHRVVQAVKPGDSLCVYIYLKRISRASASTMLKERLSRASRASASTTLKERLSRAAFVSLEASICVVYDEAERLLLEVNSELLSEDASQALAIQFGELVLKDEG